MKTYVRPLTSVVRIDETLLAGSGGSIGFDVSGRGGNSDTSGGITTKSTDEVNDGRAFAKNGMLPFEND